MVTNVSRSSTLDSFVRPPFPVRRWSVAEYEHLTNIGVLSACDKVELLEGWIVPQMTHNAPHDSAIQRLVAQLYQLMRGDWSLRIQSAIATADSVPEPDLAVVPGPAGRFDHQRPTIGDVELVIEVADTTLRQDRKKCEIYAAAAIPVYWIVNLKQREVEVFSQPDSSAAKYRASATYVEADVIPVYVAGRLVCEIPVAHILPSKGSR